MTTVALNYIFHFYRMHEHVSVSHEKADFNRNLRNCRFCCPEVDSSVSN